MFPQSFIAARQIIRDFQPDVVVGAGGYVSGPVVLTAALLKLPTLVMESNALPGWTNRVLARFVDRAAVSFEAGVAVLSRERSRDRKSGATRVL